jgi:IS30 family transposase
MKIESDSNLKEYLILNLKELRSPDEISGRMRKEKKPFCAGKKAIYKWLYSVYGQKYCRYLCTKRYRPRKQKEDKMKRVMIPDKISIFKRPTTSGLNHFEGDTMLSPKKAGTTVSVALACAIEAKYIEAAKIPNLKSKSMRNAVSNFGDELQMDSLTLDSGIENRKHKEFGVPTYFCDPHSPWQKPHIENSIGLLRRWFLPKGTNLSKVTEKELQKYIYILNHKYRKSLNYRSAYEVALERGILKRESNQKVAFEGGI